MFIFYRSFTIIQSCPSTFFLIKNLKTKNKKQHLCIYCIENKKFHHKQMINMFSLCCRFNMFSHFFKNIFVLQHKFLLILWRVCLFVRANLRNYRTNFKSNEFKSKVMVPKWRCSLWIKHGLKNIKKMILV